MSNVGCSPKATLRCGGTLKIISGGQFIEGLCVIVYFESGFAVTSISDLFTVPWEFN